MTSRTTIRGLSPVIDRYMRELEGRMRHLPADERMEILSSVEDHLADDLAGIDHPSAADIRRALDAVGPVDSVVAHTPAPDVSSAPGNVWERVLVVVIGVAALLFAIVPLVGGLLGVVAVVWGLLLRRRDRDSKTWLGGVVLGGVAIIVQIALLLGLVAWTTVSPDSGTGGVSTAVPAVSSSAALPHP